MKRVLFLSIILISFLIPNFVNAQTLQQMYNQLAQLQKQQANVDNGKKLTSSQISTLRAEINQINAEIATTEKEITAAEKSIRDSEEKIKQKKEETNQMLKYLQIANTKGNSMLEYIFDAEDYTDLIYRYSVVTQMSEANKNLMDELNKLIEELRVKKQNLAKKEAQLSSKKQEQSVKLATLNSNLSRLTEEGTSIADDIRSLRLDINKYEKMGCGKSEQVNSCILRNSTKMGMVSATGWNLPVVSAYVTSQFQVVRTDCYGCGGSSHRGIDLGVGHGTNVYAAANGRVALVVTSGSSLSCGGIKVYIYHNVNGALYTTVYMHLSQALVSEGQTVTPTTVIARSGGTESYDYCTTGPHLHFGVAYGNSVSSFNSNAFNPRNLAILSGAANGVRVSR